MCRGGDGSRSINGSISTIVAVVVVVCMQRDGLVGLSRPIGHID